MHFGHQLFVGLTHGSGLKRIVYDVRKANPAVSVSALKKRDLAPAKWAATIKKDLNLVIVGWRLAHETTPLRSDGHYANESAGRAVCKP
jgi:hypothetical protein